MVALEPSCFIVRFVKTFILRKYRMGTHIAGPTMLYEGKYDFSEFLKRNPTMVGFVPESYPGDDLPFLFKVLSIQTALSIQVLFVAISILLLLG